MTAIAVQTRRPKRAIYSREEAQLGSIRMRDAGNFQQTRMIKIRMDGKTGLRWIHFARWWWQQNRGPVPQGMRVCHKDGDLLNDDPANLFLLSGGQLLQHNLRLNPEALRRSRTGCGAFAAIRNVGDALLRRRHWMASIWYGVDFDARVIHNRPRRVRWKIYRDFGLLERISDRVEQLRSAALSGDTAAADDLVQYLDRANRFEKRQQPAALGWPLIGQMPAMILAVLAEAGEPLTTSEITRRVNLRSALCRWPQLTRMNFARVRHELEGLIESQRRPRADSFHRITDRGMSSRLPGPRIIAMRGRDIRTGDFSGFIRKEYPYESLASHLERCRSETQNPAEPERTKQTC